MAGTVYIKCIKDSVYTSVAVYPGEIAFRAGKVYACQPIGHLGYPDQYQMKSEKGLTHAMAGELGSDYFMVVDAPGNDPDTAWDRAFKGM